jgi:hypothetical protein
MLLARKRAIEVLAGQADDACEELHERARREAGIREDAGVDGGDAHRGCRGAARPRGEPGPERHADSGLDSPGGAWDPGGVLEDLFSEPSLERVERSERCCPVCPEERRHPGLVPKLPHEIELRVACRGDVGRGRIRHETRCERGRRGARNGRRAAARDRRGGRGRATTRTQDECRDRRERRESTELAQADPLPGLRADASTAGGARWQRTKGSSRWYEPAGFRRRAAG